MTSYLSYLECTICGAQYPANRLSRRKPLLWEGAVCQIRSGPHPCRGRPRPIGGANGQYVALSGTVAGRRSVQHRVPR